MKSNGVKAIFAIVLALVCLNTVAAQKYKDSSLTIEERLDDLMSRMTLEEKIGQMNQYNGFWDATGPAPDGGSAESKYRDLRNGLVGSMLNVRGVKNVKAVQKIVTEETRLGIPLIIGFDVIHGYKTLSPIPLAEASSWDLEAMKSSAKVAAAEAAAAGINWTFAPNVDVVRDARWGRVMEGAGEDPYLACKIAVARVEGFQGKDLSDPLTIAACAKHFAAYGFVEGGLEYNTVDLGMPTLYNTVLPPFKAAKEAGVRTFMNSFNILNGVPATGDAFLLRDILKGKWGFNGFVISDWASIREMIMHGYAADAQEAAKKAALAGCDMDMESYTFVKELAKLVESGHVPEPLIDDAASRILRVKFELGLFDDPYRYCDEDREKMVIYSKENRDAVLDVAKKSIVLLKNENNLLPLRKSGQKIALIGALADDKNSTLGSWRIASDDSSGVSVLEGMQKYLGNELIFERGAALTIGESTFLNEVMINSENRGGFHAAKKAALDADVVVMVLGEHGFQSGEGRSRTQIGLPGVQLDLLKEIYSINKNVVLVLNNGRPLTLEWESEHIPAIVEAWQLGTESGNAIAQVLYGDYNPSGKLPMSFPRNVGQIPIYYNHHRTGRPIDKDGNVFWSHYTDQKKTPLYPFGFGLSYTTFEYSNLHIDKFDYQIGEPIKVTVDLTNTGNFDGKEVVQLYIHDVAASLSRPVKELKGFELVDMKKGESKTIEFILDYEELGFFDQNGQYIVEPGVFQVFVGGNSEEVIKGEFQLSK